jgi:AcrR family transcriptional regulator
MTPATEPQPRTRPGGRSARVRAAVIDALLAELAENGLGELTMEGVARRAGVNKTTLYRRWGSKEELLLDALLERGERRVPIPDTGSLRDDLLTVARGIAASVAPSEIDAMVRAFAADPSTDSKLVEAARHFWAVRFSLLGEMVERAIERGELPRGTEPKPLIEGLLGRIYLRLLVTREPLDDGFLVELADWLVSRPAASPSRSHGAR